MRKCCRSWDNVKVLLPRLQMGNPCNDLKLSKFYQQLSAELISAGINGIFGVKTKWPTTPVRPVGENIRNI